MLLSPVTQRQSPGRSLQNAYNGPVKVGLRLRMKSSGNTDTDRSSFQRQRSSNPLKKRRATLSFRNVIQRKISEDKLPPHLNLSTSLPRTTRRTSTQQQQKKKEKPNEKQAGSTLRTKSKLPVRSGSASTVSVKRTSAAKPRRATSTAFIGKAHVAQQRSKQPTHPGRKSLADTTSSATTTSIRPHRSCAEQTSIMNRGESIGGEQRSNAVVKTSRVAQPSLASRKSAAQEGDAVRLRQHQKPGASRPLSLLYSPSKDGRCGHMAGDTDYYYDEYDNAMISTHRSRSHLLRLGRGSIAEAATSSGRHLPPAYPAALVEKKEAHRTTQHEQDKFLEEEPVHGCSRLKYTENLLLAMVHQHCPWYKDADVSTIFYKNVAEDRLSSEPIVERLLRAEGQQVAPAPELGRTAADSSVAAMDRLETKASQSRREQHHHGAAYESTNLLYGTRAVLDVPSPLVRTPSLDSLSLGSLVDGDTQSRNTSFATEGLHGETLV